MVFCSSVEKVWAHLKPMSYGVGALGTSCVLPETALCFYTRSYHSVNDEFKHSAGFKTALALWVKLTLAA